MRHRLRVKCTYDIKKRHTNRNWNLYKRVSVLNSYPLLLVRCCEGNKTKFARAADKFFQCEIIPPYFLKHWAQPIAFKVTIL